MPVRTRLCETKAAEILRDVGIIEPPVDVESIAGFLFLNIVQSDTREHHARAVLEHGEIRVNASDSRTGRRFSIGHELGHYLLHEDGFVFSAHEEAESELFAVDPDRELESEANYFSSVLLVPPQWLRSDVDAGSMPAELASRYQVSQEVIFIALDQHRLLNRIGRRRR